MNWVSYIFQDGADCGQWLFDDFLRCVYDSLGTYAVSQDTLNRAVVEGLKLLCRQVSFPDCPLEIQFLLGLFFIRAVELTDHVRSYLHATCWGQWY